MTYIYNGAKHRRSGTTMQKLPSRGDLIRANRAREVEPGYPWEGKFTTRAQVEEYLAGDQVTCLLCGKQFEQLPWMHLGRIHGTNAADYKTQFGIPQGWGLIGRALRMKKIEQAALICLAEKAPEKKYQPRKTVNRAHVPFVKSENADRFRSIPKLPKHVDFGWHLALIAERWDFRTVQPPTGHASWSCFKKRLAIDASLRAAKAAAVDARRAPKALAA